MRLEKWRNFLHLQQGCYPSKLAADYLRMSTQGVWKAAERGWLAYVQIGKTRYYGKRDLENYRHSVSRKFRDSRPQPSATPKCYNLD